MRFANGMKTAFLLGLMGALILVVGYWLGGTTGLVIALVIAIGINGFSYWNSGKLAITRDARASGNRGRTAGDVSASSATLRCSRASRCRRCMYRPPWPPTLSLPDAIRRTPPVCCTEGILQLLDERELRGVLAHELGHVYNRDILIASVAATMASVIMFVAQFAWFIPIGGRGGDRGKPVRGRCFC